MRILLLSILTVLMVSCQKAERDLDNSTNTAEDYMLAQTIYNDIFSSMSKVASLTPGISSTGTGISSIFGCDEIKVDTLSYPKQIIIDFKFLGCGDTYLRYGRLIGKFYGTYAEVGSTMDIEFLNYYFEEYLVDGKLRVIFKENNASGNPVHSFFLQNGAINDEDDAAMTWTTSQQWERKSVSNGYTQYNVTGTSNGTNRKGNVFYTEINETNVMSEACLYMLSGTVDIEVVNLSKRLLNYGNGKCDYAADVLINGATYPVRVNL